MTEEDKAWREYIIRNAKRKRAQEKIAHEIVQYLSYTDIVQGLPNGMTNKEPIKDLLEKWRKV